VQQRCQTLQVCPLAEAAPPSSISNRQLTDFDIAHCQRSPSSRYPFRTPNASEPQAYRWRTAAVRQTYKRPAMDGFTG